MQSFSLQFVNTYIAVIYNIVFGTSIDIIYVQVCVWAN